MRKVCVVSTGMTKWGKRKATWRDLISEAGKVTFDNAPNLSKDDIEGFICSSAVSDRTSNTIHAAPIAAETLGIKPTKIISRIEHLCGSGSAAIILASSAIATGLLDVCMIGGVEKLNVPNPKEAIHDLAICTGDYDWESFHGVTPPAFFAMVAQHHAKKYGLKDEQRALVSVKSHRFSTKNPYAHFQKEYTLQEVLDSRMIATPLRLLECCPLTDGAAGVILASEEKTKKITDTPVYVAGYCQASCGGSISSLPDLADLTDWSVLKTAAEGAYKMAGVTAKDIDAAEVHDCFTISEIQEYEHLGFAEKGKGGKFIEEGQAEIGGKVVVNPSGGLLSRGHPFGATGIAQCHEIFCQLTGKAGNQAPNAEVGLTHNLTGTAISHTVVIYKRR